MDQGEFPNDIKKGNVHQAFESDEHVKDLNSKIKLELYNTFGKEVEFKRYFHGISDAGTRLLFKFWSSGTRLK